MSPRAVVFVIDDDLSFRQSLSRLVESVGLVARAYSDPQQFMAECDPDQAGCILLDLRMPGLSGLDVQSELAQRGITLPIIFITGHGDVPSTVRAMKAGAVDFLEKPVSGQVILDAVHRAIQVDAANRREAGAVKDVERRAARLTPREREVFALVVTGMTNAQVAHSLGASEKTIKVHRGRVMAKMQADSLPDLVVMAQQLGISRPNSVAT